MAPTLLSQLTHEWKYGWGFSLTRTRGQINYKEIEGHDDRRPIGGKDELQESFAALTHTERLRCTQVERQRAQSACCHDNSDLGSPALWCPLKPSGRQSLARPGSERERAELR